MIVSSDDEIDSEIRMYLRDYYKKFLNISAPPLSNGSSHDSDNKEF